MNWMWNVSVLPVRVAAIFFEVSGLADDGDGFQFGGSRHGNKAQEDDLSFI